MILFCGEVFLHKIRKVQSTRQKVRALHGCTHYPLHNARGVLYIDLGVHAAPGAVGCGGPVKTSGLDTINKQHGGQSERRYFQCLKPTKN